MERSERGQFEDEWRKALDGAEQAPSEGVWNSINSKPEQGTGYEARWQKAFDGAEVAPSEEVWKAIDVSLVQAENASMKRRVVFYQRIAAASIIVLMLMSGYALFLQGDNNQRESVASTGSSKENTGQSSPNTSTSINDESTQANSNTESDPNSIAETQSDKRNSAETNGGLITTNRSTRINSNSRDDGQREASRINNPNNHQNSSQQVAINHMDADNVAGENKIGAPANNSGSSQSKTQSARAFTYKNGPIAEILPVPLKEMPETFHLEGYAIAYRLADLMPARRTSKKKPNLFENQWASVGFGAGSYNSGVGGNTLTQTSATKTGPSGFSALQADQSTTRDEKVKPGASMSMTISAGKRFFKRWILQGGISYMNQSTTSTASTVTAAPANQAALDGKFSGSNAPENTNSVTYTTESDINSNYQFLSIPVQAGYMIIDRKFGLQINGGVAPDFFLKSSVYDEATKTETVNSATGTNDTFKSISLAGLGGIELSYRFSKHYRISLVPGFRYSFTQVYKENSLASSKPFVADIGLRFRYVFNN
jgi:hypothetical protein